MLNERGLYTRIPGYDRFNLRYENNYYNMKNDLT